MALTVIFVLGIVVIHAVTRGTGMSEQTNSTVITTMLGTLGGLVSAITGFYFGQRAAEQKAEKGGDNDKNGSSPGGGAKPAPKRPGDDQPGV